MYILKTSGATIVNVIKYQKHAFKNKPKEWCSGELALISKNKNDCQRGEKQIQYITKLNNIRELRPGEAENLWPGSEGRWDYLVKCGDMQQISEPFDISDIIGKEKYTNEYSSVVCFKRLPSCDEELVREHISKTGTI